MRELELSLPNNGCADPNAQICLIPCCMQSIIENTHDVDVNLVFNNAGYITTGLFADLGLDRQLRNYEVIYDILHGS